MLCIGRIEGLGLCMESQSEYTKKTAFISESKQRLFTYVLSVEQFEFSITNTISILIQFFIRIVHCNCGGFR